MDGQSSNARMALEQPGLKDALALTTVNESSFHVRLANKKKGVNHGKEIAFSRADYLAPMDLSGLKQ